MSSPLQIAVNCMRSVMDGHMPGYAEPEHIIEGLIRLNGILLMKEPDPLAVLEGIENMEQKREADGRWASHDEMRDDAGQVVLSQEEHMELLVASEPPSEEPEPEFVHDDYDDYDEPDPDDYFDEPDYPVDEGPWSIHDILDKNHPGMF